MAKRKNVKKSRSFSEKVMIVLSILIAASMILGLVVGLGGGFGGSSSSLIDPFLVQAQLWVTLF